MPENCNVNAPLDRHVSKEHIRHTDNKVAKSIGFLCRINLFFRFFAFRHLFPSCFLINEMPEKLENVFGSDQKHFCRKTHFLFDLLVFPPLQDI